MLCQPIHPLRASTATQMRKQPSIANGPPQSLSTSGIPKPPLLGITTVVLEASVS